MLLERFVIESGRVGKEKVKKNNNNSLRIIDSPLDEFKRSIKSRCSKKKRKIGLKNVEKEKETERSESGSVEPMTQKGATSKEKAKEKEE